MPMIIEQDVFVKPFSCNFWWAVYGFKKEYLEDVSINYKRGGKKFKHYTSIITKGFIRQELEHKSLEEAEYCWGGYCKPLDEMIKGKDILISEKESSWMFHPAEEISKEVIKEAVGEYCRKICKIMPSKIYIVGNVMKRNEAKKDYLQYLKDIKLFDEHIKAGRMFLTPEVLEQLEGIPNDGNIAYGSIRDGNLYATLRDGSEKHIRLLLRKEK